MIFPMVAMAVSMRRDNASMFQDDPADARLTDAALEAGKSASKAKLEAA